MKQLKKRLLYLEDLYNFYENAYKKSTHFSAKDFGEPIVVQVHGNVKFDESDYSKEGLRLVHLQSCHTLHNINNSNIEQDVMENALPSFSNRPILGYIHKVYTDEHPDGQWEFYSHNMHEDENGDTVYDEIPVGVIPESCNAQLVYDEKKKKTYCEVDGYIYEEYSKAAEILEREGECSVSVELSISDLSYNAKEHYLNIEKFWFSGVTILGKTPSGQKVMPGMEGANIQLSDFSSKNNSLFTKYDSQMIDIQTRLDKLESVCFNKSEHKEGGNSLNKFEELLTKYNKTVEDITFDYSELSDEELEAKFSEMFDEINPEEDETEDPDPSEEETFENMIRSYELSHDDVRYALYNLLAPYEDADNDWYFINSVYDTHFTYENWDGNKIYGQNYVKDGDSISFDGERYNLHRELLTDAEYAQLSEMRSNYSSLVEFKNNVEKNESHAAKESILMDEKYSVVSTVDKDGKFENEAFANLYEHMDEFSEEELTEKVKAIVGEYAMNGGKFSADEKHISTPKVFRNVSKPKKNKKIYGNLFN